MKKQAVVRVAYFDLLNIMSCFSVVILHCNGYVHTLNHVGAWGVRVFYEVVLYFAVPVFFMLSGATLLDYRAKYDTKAYFTKRLRRTFLPFVIFSILFSAISWMQTMRAGGSLPNLNGVMGSILMTKVPGTVYWFFIPLFLLYLVFPILSLAVERMSDKMMFYTCGLLAGFEVLLPFVFTFAKKESFETPWSVSNRSGVIPIFLTHSHCRIRHMFVRYSTWWNVISLGHHQPMGNILNSNSF